MDVGLTLPWWSVVPFAGMLLSIAVFPLVKPVWWEKRQLHVAAFWSAVFLVPFALAYGLEETGVQLAEVVVLDYVPFIVLLLGLFVVSGGIHVKGTMAGTTKNNVVLLAIGTLLASWVGTTGAAMLLIRPVLRANAWRRNKTHIVVFFIFLVANIGGCLTPLGDPPLFLGYLRGVPFFWTLQHIWPLLLLNSVVLLGVFALVDRHFVKKEGREGEEALELEEEAVERVPVRIEGLRNLWYLALIIVAVVLNGAIPQTRECLDPATGLVWGVDVCEGVHLGFNYFLQIGLIGLAAILSLATTPRALREKNDFEWAPIAEVAKLFIGIFVTMIPALALLRAYGAELGIDTPLKFFWATGALSSFPGQLAHLRGVPDRGRVAGRRRRDGRGHHGGRRGVQRASGHIGGRRVHGGHDLHRQRPQLHGEVHSRAFRREDAQLLRVHGVVAGHFGAPLRAGHGAVLPVRGVPWEGSADGDVRVAA